MLTRAEVARILFNARTDPAPLIESALWIRAKDGSVVPFKLNQAQWRVLAVILKLIREGKLIRVIILKARQVGISTLIEALLFLRLLCYPHQRATVLTHERDLSQELMRMSAFYLENLDDRLRPTGPAPSMNKIELDSIPCVDGEVMLRSRVNVDTATGKESGRGKTIPFLHLAEFAFFPDPDKTLRGLLPSVPKVGSSVVVIESTANGMDNAMYRRWNQAVRGEGSFVPIFIPWFELDEYRIPPDEPLELNETELELQRLYGLDEEQLNFRRVTIADEFEGNEEEFCVEYPGTAEEAFKHSGSPAFNRKILLEYSRQAAPLTYHQGEVVKGDPPRFVEDEAGQLKMWQRPVEGHEYLIGADTALGAEGGDASALAVIDRNTNRFVATWWGFVEPHRLARIMAALGYFYNTAILAPETNNTGISTLLELHEHLEYPNIYRWRKYDNMKNVWTDKLGWLTTQWSRPLLIDDMTMALRERLIGIPSVQMCQELMIFDVGKDRVADDDLATAAMIGWHCHLRSFMQDGTRPRAMLEAAQVEKGPTLDPVSAQEWKGVRAMMKRLRSRHGADVSPDMAQLHDAIGTPADHELDDPMPEIPY